MNSSSIPLFSFIVPVYNTAEYVEKCLTSILNQTLKNIEILVIDDGSTDTSLSICAGLAEKFSNLSVFSKINEGQGIARNFGVSLAKGKYIGFVDSDDWIEPELCADMCAILEGAEIDFVNFGIDFTSLSGKVIKKLDKFKLFELCNEEIFYHALVDDQIMSVSYNKIYRRELLLNGNISFPALRANEDIYYSRAVSRAARKTKFVSKVYYHCLVRPGSVSRGMGVGIFLDTERLIKIERDDFIGNVANIQLERIFRAHVVKLLTYLLTQAAFRIPNRAEYFDCFHIVERCGVFEYASDVDVLRLLKFKNKLIAKLCKYPKIMKGIATILNTIGVRPY